MTDHRSLSLSETAERLLKTEDPLILIHTKPDGDCYGSAAALSQIFTLLGKASAILSPEPIPERLAFITALSDAKPYEEGKSYTPIAIDVASPSQLGSLEGCFSPALQIDHHARGIRFADFYLDADAAAAGEIVFEIVKILLKQGNISEIPPRLASAIYTAISSDTGCFRQANTTAKTHTAAAELITLGADFAAINHALFETKSPRQMRAEATVMANIRLHKDGKVASFTTRKKDRERDGLLTEDFETSIDIVRAVKGVEVAVVVKEADTKENLYKISFRSTGADVSRVAAHFGGGGHIRAAGCTVEAENAEKALAAVLERLYPKTTSEPPERTEN